MQVGTGIMTVHLRYAAALAMVCSSVSANAFAQSSSSSQVIAVGCSSVVVDASAAGAPSAPALCPPLATEMESVKRRVWYGWQTLAADGTALVLAVAAGESERNESSVALASLAVYALGAPIVHVANGSPGKMGLSLGMRVGAPLLLGMGGYYAAGGGGRSDSWAPALTGVLGAMIGMAGAVAVDAAVLARKDAPPERKAARLRITPSVAPARGGATVGAIGTF